MKIYLVATLFSLASGVASAQEANEAWEEYGKRVAASTQVNALGPDLFGDQVSLSNGALSFSVTDVSLPGNNGLPVEFTRTFSVEGRKGSYVNAEFPLADWEIDLPNISGVFAPDWVSAIAASPGKRCSVTTVTAARPPVVVVADTYFQPKDYWQGHNLSLPSGGGEMLLLDPSRPKPTAGGPYYWITADQTRVACLPAIQNWPGGGEGFLAISPDGTKYWFDWMAQYLEEAIEASTTMEVMGLPKTYSERHARRRNVLYPTRIEDRFGNSVTYTYTNARTAPVRLTTIQSSDGRRIDIHYNSAGNAGTVVAHGRTWSYQYAAANNVDKTLSAVVLPDATRWTIDFAGLLNSQILYTRGVPNEPWRSCTHQPDLISPESFSGRVTHPSGAVGDFTVKPQLHGRTNVPLNCEKFTVPHNYGNDDVSFWTISYHALSLAEKKISGVGLPAGSWTYDYQSPISWYKPGGDTSYPVCPANMDCSIPRCTSDDCAGASRTTVTDPAGKWIRYYHGNSYRYNEGKLLKVEEGQGTAILRTTWNTYDLTQLDHEYPAKWGTSPRMIGDGFASEFHRPLYQRSVVQDGTSFNYQVYTFDQFARPVEVTRERAPAAGTSPNPPAGTPSLVAPATSNTGAFSVSWSKVDAATYRLERRLDGGAWALLYNGGLASHAVTSTANGAYDFRVKACNADSCGGYSPVVTTIVTRPPTGVPVLMAPVSSNTGAFNVSWGPVPLATSYLLQQQKDAGAWAQIHNGAATAKSISGLVNGTYNYRVRGCNAGGCTSFSAVKTTTVSLPPGGAPALTTPATSSTGAFTVSWSAVALATNYRLELQKDGGSWSQIYSAAGTSTPFSGLGNGSYAYRVRACNAVGCGGYSSAATTVVTLPPGSAPVVSAPGSSSSGAFTVSWTAVASATNYRLEQSKDGGTWTQIQSGTAASKALTGLGNGSYAYRARACNAGGCSGYSALRTTVVTLPPGSAPAVSAPASSNTGAFAVSWSAVATATSYRLEQSKDGGTWSQIHAAGGTSKAVSGLGNGSYRFRVRACNAGGCSGYSAIVTTAVLLPPASAPSVTTPAASSNGSYAVSWTAVASATNYRLEQQQGSGTWSQIYSGSGRSKAVSGLGNGSYDYRARACNAAGCSGYSATRVTTVTWPPPTAPALSVPMTAPANTVYTVRWNLVDTATNYELQLSALGGAWTSIYSGSLQYHAQNHRLDGSYAYRVRACNAGGCTAYSATKTVVLYPSGGTCTGGFCPDPLSTGPGKPLTQPLMDEEGN